HGGSNDGCKVSTARHHRSREEERGGLKASSRHRDASIADRNGRDDEGNRLAAAFRAWLPCWRGSQKAEAETQFAEDRRRPRLPNCGRRLRQIWTPPVQAFVLSIHAARQDRSGSA